MVKQITYKQLFEFIGSSNAYIAKTSSADTKLTQSIKSVLKQIRKEEIVEDFNEKINIFSLDNCTTDVNTGVILKENGDNLRFTVEAQKKVNKYRRTLMKETTPIHQRILSGNEKVELTDAEKEAFSGIVIPEVIDEIIVETKEEETKTS